MCQKTAVYGGSCDKLLSARDCRFDEKRAVIGACERIEVRENPQEAIPSFEAELSELGAGFVSSM